MAIDSHEYPEEVVRNVREISPAADYRMPITDIANFLVGYKLHDDSARYNYREMIISKRDLTNGWELWLQASLATEMSSGLLWERERHIYPNTRQSVDLWGEPQTYRQGGLSNNQSIGIELKCEHEGESKCCRKGFIEDVAKALQNGVTPEYIGTGWDDSRPARRRPGVAPRTLLICVAVTTKREHLSNSHGEIQKDWPDAVKRGIAGLTFYHKRLYKKQMSLRQTGPDLARADLWLMWCTVPFNR
jgi:hypothetical protein